MLNPRLIPCLLLHDGGVVKTVNFRNPNYIGDPLNAVKIFNEKEVDELIIIDIDATVQSQSPNYSLIEKLAAECRMPISYGGGIKNEKEIRRIISLGIEKVSVSSLFVSNPYAIKDLGQAVGKQSISVVIDVKKDRFNNHSVYTHNGKKKAKNKLDFYIKFLQENPVGEIVVNSINNDGKMCGFDHQLIRKFSSKLRTPIIAMGGAGSLNHIQKLISNFGIIGAACGSLFLYKGSYKAVLLNYPSDIQKKATFQI